MDTGYIGQELKGYGLLKHLPLSINQSINLLKSLRGIEVALSIRARGLCIKRMPKIKEIKLNK